MKPSGSSANGKSATSANSTQWWKPEKTGCGKLLTENFASCRQNTGNEIAIDDRSRIRSRQAQVQLVRRQRRGRLPGRSQGRSPGSHGRTGGTQVAFFQDPLQIAHCEGGNRVRDRHGRM